jgi:uncharacterized protein (DUF2147 family)
LFAQTISDSVLGTWFNGSKESKIEIFKCNDRYCGRIVWLKEPNNAEGLPKIDKNNPDTKLQNRPVLGMVLMRDFIYGGDNVWDKGEIYDPKSGKTYSCKMALVNPNRLDVRGFLGISLIGRTDTWTRAQ